MGLLRCVVLLQVAAAVALGQPVQLNLRRSPSKQAEALVRNLYAEVVSRHPHDIPNGANMKDFAPYLSKALLHRIDLAKACAEDWDRQNPKLHLTSGYGLFIGGDANFRNFQIEGTQSEKKGSLRVNVRLTAGKTPERTRRWRVAPVVLREDGKYVIDDVIYINDSIYDNLEAKPADKRLSEYLSAGCSGPDWIGYYLPSEPEALARSLYQQVVARRPVGIPRGADWKALAPYLSKALLHRIDLALACGDDWDRQDQRRMLMKGEVIEKAPLGWLELGLFSGGDDEDELRAFQIERTESEKDGSFRMNVRLIWGWPPEKPWMSQVAAILVPESSRLVVDDVIYLKDAEDKYGVEYRLSGSLSYGCDGPRWVGLGDEPKDLKQEK